MFDFVDVNGNRYFYSSPHQIYDSNGNRLTVSFSPLLPLQDYGPVGGADDSSTWAQAMSQAASLFNSTKVRQLIQVPAGTTTIGTGAALPSMVGIPWGLVGMGSMKSNIKISPSYSGNVFVWQESWISNSESSGSFVDLTQAAFGPVISGLSILGNTTSVNQQNAIVFYNRNDLALLSDLFIGYVPGNAFACGKVNGVGSGGQAYMRESSLRNVRVYNCGLSSVPAVDIDSNATTSADATNSIDIAGLRIFGSAGKGMVIQSNSNNSAVRQIRITNLQIEGLQGGTSGDLLTINNNVVGGSVNSIMINNCTLLNPGTGASAIKFVMTSGASAPYEIDFSGQLGCSIGTTCTGVNILALRTSRIHLSGLDMGGSGTAMNVGPTSGGVGSDIVFDCKENNTYTIDASAAGLLQFPQFSNFTSGAASNTATLTNAPVSGNPTKWVPVYDPLTATTRYSPLW